MLVKHDETLSLEDKLHQSTNGTECVCCNTARSNTDHDPLKITVLSPCALLDLCNAVGPMPNTNLWLKRGHTSIQLVGANDVYDPLQYVIVEKFVPLV